MEREGGKIGGGDLRGQVGNIAGEGEVPDVTKIKYSIGCPLPLDLSHCAVLINLERF